MLREETQGILEEVEVTKSLEYKGFLRISVKGLVDLKSLFMFYPPKMTSQRGYIWHSKQQ